MILWSSFGEDGYAIGISRSSSGKLEGPWIHDEQPLLGKDGGHGMLFHTWEGQWTLTIHTPNETSNERPIFIQVSANERELHITSS